MANSVTAMGRGVRRRLKQVVHKGRDKDYARRALALLQLWETQGNVTESAHRVRAARSSVYRWESSYETYGEEGIRPHSPCRSPGLSLFLRLSSRSSLCASARCLGQGAVPGANVDDGE